MADAIRVNTSLPIHVIGVGPFGAEVGRNLQRHCDAHVSLVEDGRLQPSTWPLARLHVLVSWRVVAGIASEIEAAAFAWHVPWLPIVQEHPLVTIGPLVVPGTTPCYQCFRARLMQHSSIADLLEPLERYYGLHTTEGPAGFLPSIVTAVAATALAAIIDLDHGSAGAGVARQLNVQSLHATSFAVLGRHGCPRCGTRGREQERSYVQLARELPGILAGEAPDA